MKKEMCGFVIIALILPVWLYSNSCVLCVSCMNSAANLNNLNNCFLCISCRNSAAKLRAAECFESLRVKPGLSAV
jgi:hypothetical protein